MELGRPRAHWRSENKEPSQLAKTLLRLASRVEASRELDLRLPARCMTRYEARFHINTEGHFHGARAALRRAEHKRDQRSGFATDSPGKVRTGKEGL